MGETYICFEQEWMKEKEKRKSYINLDTDEWSEFIKILWKLDEHMKHQYPYMDIKKCFECKDEKKLVKMFERKLKITNLDPNKHTNISIANSLGVEEQRCEYCGKPTWATGCHCHEFDCRQCSPESYCQGCGENVYKKAEWDF